MGVLKTRTSVREPEVWGMKRSDLMKVQQKLCSCIKVTDAFTTEAELMGREKNLITLLLF